jgi:hypothetical protein
MALLFFVRKRKNIEIGWPLFITLIITVFLDVVETVGKNYNQFKKEAERMQKHGIKYLY